MLDIWNRAISKSKQKALKSFGAFADFYLFCANRWGDSRMRDEHYMLRRANSLRNAAAHSSAIVNGLGFPLGAPQLRYPAPFRGSRRNRHVQAPQALEDAQSAHPADGRSSLRLL